MGKDLKGKELGKGILQRKDGRYCGRFTDRFGQRQNLYSFKLSELRTMMTEAMYENDKRLNVYNERITVDDWYEKWIELYKKNIVRDTTLKNYQSNYRAHIKEKIGFIRLRDLNMAHIQKLLNGMRDAGYHYKTILQVRIILVDMFEKAILSEFMTKNPAKNVTIVKDGKQERRVLTQDEESEFLKAASGNWYEMLFQLALLTGLRQGELCALTWDDVDWDAGLLHVTKTLIYSKLEGETAISFKINPPKTQNSRRDIPLTDEALRILKKQKGQDEWLMAQMGKRGKLKPLKGFENLIFKTRTAAPISGQTFGDAIKTVIRTINKSRAEGMPEFEHFTPHTLRHTFATRCFENGMKPRTLQDILGHASLDMTMGLYTHVTQEQKRREVDKIASIRAVSSGVELV